MTANVMSDDVERYKAAGFDDYIGKPFELQQFVDTVARCLGDKQTLALTPESLQDNAAETDLKAMLKQRFPDYLQSIESSWREMNLGLLKHEVHQLKGAALLFEFPVIGDVCRDIEAGLVPRDGQINIAAIAPKVEALLALLQD
ncbi:Hpt domain-containing protein [Candidatus Pelagadaptatus aseana]|uniref:Hpt domain-containing protein n=1 Tax=Candidatus Pelagadaptatus aseana TaxID=3120508 RepID=UPI003C703536